MREAFILLGVIVGLAIFYLLPFALILRGGRPLRVIAIGWLSAFGYIVFLCLLLPGIVHLFSKEMGREMLNNWVPEGPAVVAVGVMGWVPAVMAVAVGMVVKTLLNRFCPVFSKRFEPKSPEVPPVVPQAG